MTVRMELQRALSDPEAVLTSIGESSAFEQVFDRHVRTIYRFAWRRVGDNLANDVTAETFTVAFAKRADFDPEVGEVLPWLFGIATNVIRAHRRAERRRLLAYLRTGIDPLGAVEPIEDRIDSLAAGPALARALAHLRPNDRDVLLLYAWGDLSYEEISRSLGIPIGTVASRMSRARRTLRTALEAAGWSRGSADELEGDDR